MSIVDGGSGTRTGTVTFQDAGDTIGSGSLNASGVATFVTTALSVSSHSMIAIYNGDTNFTSSTSVALTQTVKQSPTSTTLTSSANPSVSGQSVTFTATVVASGGGAGTPSGNVTFKDGASTLGTGTLNASGVATFTTATLSVNPHSITGVYSGSTSFAGSTSAVLTQTVKH